MNEKAINDILLRIKNKTITEQLQYLSEKFRGAIAFSTSFGIEDQVITHTIFSNNLPIDVFTLDTGRNFEETYKVMARTIEKYQKPIKAFFPNSNDVENLLLSKGPNSFYLSVENRIECCNIRKVKPLKKALKGVNCWITGLRSEQSDARQSLKLIEWEPKFRLLKFNPLIEWTTEMVQKFISVNNIPYNSLHDKGFVSIGCEPCTRAIKPGEHFRAGRWWWEDNTKKECGLHQSNQTKE
jgi:phosphoadenosine phosphosulfate reductase